MFAATKLQVATYLLGVCPFSIAFLVFLNSSVSFVVTDLIGQEDHVGDAVGTLGFADELLALIACPLWGLLSDRIGVRYVCVAGFLIICLALSLFVQAQSVYPQLLLARLLFSFGASAVATMVTAVLPTMSPATSPVNDAGLDSNGHGTRFPNGVAHISSPSIASELTITPARFQSRGRPNLKNSSISRDLVNSYASASRVAGFVGMFTGCGALIALLIFLPLPAKFQHVGKSPEMALKLSFYIVASIAFVLALCCFFGLQNLQYEKSDNIKTSSNQREHVVTGGRFATVWHNLYTALTVGFQRSDIALGYLGGFVARASSVAISLFIPLLVNALFLSTNLCKIENLTDTPQGLPDIKRKCPRAYVLAAELTGVSQLVALISAPIFGYASARTNRRGLPLIVASAAGIIGYPLFATQFDPDDGEKGKRSVAFLSVCLIGISQIGTIVCSLGILSHGVTTTSNIEISEPRPEITSEGEYGERDALLSANSTHQPKEQSLAPLKGSIAGIYSFYGGAAILVLTKLGGTLFDKVSVGAPFYIMTGFNAVLMIACILLGLRQQSSETS